METTSVEALKMFFSTPEKPVTWDELKALGSQGIRDLAKECAPALGVQLQYSGDPGPRFLERKEPSCVPIRFTP